MRKSTRQDYTGERFGRLVVTGDAPDKGKHRRVFVICDCGTEKEVFLTSLKTDTKSCGCYHKEQCTTHGQSQNKNPLYRAWTNMKSRCYDPNAKFYPEYGGRGITVCDEWVTDYVSFEAWAHRAGFTLNLSLDRRSNGEGYSPDNCRWVTKTTQQRNRRAVKNSSSQYIGVSLDTGTGKWLASIKIEKKSVYIGRYETATEAARARDVYVIDNKLNDYTLNNVS